jgi:Flp pilus assembly protein TadG
MPSDRAGAPPARNGRGAVKDAGQPHGAGGAPAHRGRIGSRGQALVELTLVVPLLLLLTIGVLDGARLFTTHISLLGGVREAVMFASSGTGYENTAAIRQKVLDDTSGIDPAAISVNTTCDGGGACDDDSTDVTVRAVARVNMFIGLNIWPTTFDVTVDVTGRIVR